MLIISLFAGVLTLLPLLFLLYVKWNQKYWARKRVPYIQPSSMWGNIENPFRQKYGVKHILKEAYLEFKRRGVPHGGIYLFTEAAYLPVDPELLKNILSIDFQNFNGHGFPHDDKKDPLSAHLFNLDGIPWRNTRIKLTPIFTSGKMKMMFDTLLECGGPMIRYIDAKIKQGGEPVDIKETVSSFTIDVIGSCAFGLECNSFKDPNAEFKKYGRQVTASSPRNKLYNFMKFVAPSVGKVVHVRRVSLDMEQFFVNLIKGVLDYRKSKGVSRNDFVQLFLELEQKARIDSGESSFTVQQIAAQAYVFFVGGFETSATTMSFLLHELAYNQEIQEKLREEVRDTMKRYDDRLTYAGIMEMKYLDQVVNETLRKYPPIPFLNRICTKDYKVPNTDVIIKKGTSVVISSLGIQRDEEYYPDPEKFDPERFSEENKRSRPAFTFLPFGEGPRICIGQRFGLMQTKTGISLLLNNYKFLPADGGNYKLTFEPTSLILGTNEPIKLNASKLDQNISRYY